MVQDLSKFKVPKGFRGRSALIVQLWWAVQSLLIHPSPQVLYGWRRFWLRAFGAQIGKKVIIRPSVNITYPWKLIIGDYSWIGDDVNIYNLETIEIGHNSVISQKSYLCGGGHDYKKEDFEIFAKKIQIGNECWIATDVFISPGVSIGNKTVVGARSTVLNSIDEGLVVAGNPVRIIKKRTE